MSEAGKSWMRVWKELPPAGAPVEIQVKVDSARELRIHARLLEGGATVRFECLATGEALPAHWHVEYWRAAAEEPSPERLRIEAATVRQLVDR